jgi:thiol-disulfide isomerase/thioredoxin
MKDTIKKYIKEGLIFVVVFAIAANGISYYRSLDLNKETLDLSSVQLLDSSVYPIPEQKPLLVHFWATWCPVCKVEAPNIQAISEDYEVLTVAVQSGSKENIQQYLKKHNLSFNVVNDEEGIYSRKFNIQVFPTTLIYDKNRNLRFSEVGYTTTAGLYSRMALIK